MILDAITEFCKDYHVVRYGLVTIGIVSLFIFFFRRCNGEWIWTRKGKK